MAVVTRGLLLVSLLFAGCAPSEEEVTFLTKKAFLSRQNQGIRELIAEAERGSMVPADRFLIGVDEKIVADLLSSELPLERPIGKRFIVRLEHATVGLRDKFGAIILEGTLHRPSTPDRKTTVRIYGGLGAVSIDTTTDMLSVRIAIDHIEILKAGLLEGVIGPGGKKFLAEKGRDLLQDALPSLHIPVVLGRKFHVPSVESGAVRLDSLTVPLNLTVERVIAARSKLWVTLNAEVGTVTGAEEGLGVVVKKKRRPAVQDSSAGHGGAR